MFGKCAHFVFQINGIIVIVRYNSLSWQNYWEKQNVRYLNEPFFGVKKKSVLVTKIAMN